MLLMIWTNKLHTFQANDYFVAVNSRISGYRCNVFSQHSTSWRAFDRETKWPFCAFWQCQRQEANDRGPLTTHWQKQKIDDRDKTIHAERLTHHRDHNVLVHVMLKPSLAVKVSEMLYLLRTSEWDNTPLLSQFDDKALRRSLTKILNVDIIEDYERDYEGFKPR